MLYSYFIVFREIIYYNIYNLIFVIFKPNAEFFVNFFKSHFKILKKLNKLK